MSRSFINVILSVSYMDSIPANFSSPEGIDARTEFTHRLSTVEVAIHNQDDREHDIFDVSSI